MSDETIAEAKDDPEPQKKRGFAAMSPERRREIASMGGKRAQHIGVAHVFTDDELRRGGQRGGAVSSQDREHMREIGRKGGQKLAEDVEHMRRIGRNGGARAAELGLVGRRKAE